MRLILAVLLQVRQRDRSVVAGTTRDSGPCGVASSKPKEMLVENRTAGNSFWLQFGILLWRQEN
jgi:hypothetical protein